LLIFILVRRHVTFKLSVFQLWQTNFASYEESTGGLVWGFYTFRDLDITA